MIVALWLLYNLFGEGRGEEVEELCDSLAFRVIFPL